MSVARKPLEAQCSKCNHVWTFAYTPADINLIVRLSKAALCPSCGNKKDLMLKMQPKDQPVHRHEGGYQPSGPMSGDAIPPGDE